MFATIPERIFTERAAVVSCLQSPSTRYHPARPAAVKSRSGIVAWTVDLFKLKQTQTVTTA